jgi:hypothetical protein
MMPGDPSEPAAGSRVIIPSGPVPDEVSTVAQPQARPKGAHTHIKDALLDAEALFLTEAMKKQPEHYDALVCPVLNVMLQATPDGGAVAMIAVLLPKDMPALAKARFAVDPGKYMHDKLQTRALVFPPTVRLLFRHNEVPESVPSIKDLLAAAAEDAQAKIAPGAPGGS